MRERSTILAHIAIIMANVLIAVNYNFVKNVIPEPFSGTELAYLRIVSGAIFFGVIALFMGGWRVALRDLPRLIATGVLGSALVQIFLLEGLARSSPIDGSIITTSTPIIVMLLSALLYGERITLARLLGILLCTGGAIYIVMQGDSSEAAGSASRQLEGCLLLVGATLFYGLYYILLAPLAKRYNIFVVYGWVYCIAALFMLTFMSGTIVNFDFKTLNPKELYSLGFVLIFATLLAYALMGVSLKRISPTIASAYSYFKPVVTLVAAAALGADQITTPRVIAVSLVLLGSYFIIRNPRIVR